MNSPILLPSNEVNAFADSSARLVDALIPVDALAVVEQEPGMALALVGAGDVDAVTVGTNGGNLLTFVYVKAGLEIKLACTRARAVPNAAEFRSVSNCQNVKEGEANHCTCTDFFPKPFFVKSRELRVFDNFRHWGTSLQRT